MALRSRAMLPSTASRVMIRVDRYGMDGVGGLMRNPYLGKSVYFQDLVDFTNKLDSLCDEISFPQAATAYRSFTPRHKKTRPAPSSVLENDEAAAAEPLKPEDAGVFVVHVQLRQNASWQGTVAWAGQSRVCRFRSTLELVKLIDRVLGGNAPDAGSPV